MLLIFPTNKSQKHAYNFNELDWRDWLRLLNFLPGLEIPINYPWKQIICLFCSCIWYFWGNNSELWIKQMNFTKCTLVQTLSQERPMPWGDSQSEKLRHNIHPRVHFMWRSPSASSLKGVRFVGFTILQGNKNLQNSKFFYSIHESVHYNSKAHRSLYEAAWFSSPWKAIYPTKKSVSLSLVKASIP